MKESERLPWCFTPNIIASPANVAFAKANLAQLKPKMDAADGIGARR
jgi:hypothetical protein